MKKDVIYIILVICLVIFAVAAVVYDSYGFRTGQRGYIHSFQKATGGLGLGAVTKPAWCYINYDTRIEGSCSCIEWPVPGGYCYCPDHTGSIASPHPSLPHKGGGAGLDGSKLVRK
ncbi:MAG: hypothetical protein HY034_00890 [Nitrospirae bacterium]|nr:hypothetical protein [Nitrospirota bacterium]